MIEKEHTPLRARVHLLDTRFLLTSGPNVADAVDLACDLVVAGLDPPTTIAVAALRRDASLSDSEQLLLSMLSEHGIQVPRPSTEKDRFVALRHAFGFWDLPLHAFEGPFYERIPEWDEQDSLDQAPVILLDQRTTKATRAAGRNSRNRCVL